MEGEQWKGCGQGKHGEMLLETPTQTQVEGYRSTEESSAPCRSEASRDRRKKKIDTVHGRRECQVCGKAGKVTMSQ